MTRLSLGGSKNAIHSCACVCLLRACVRSMRPPPSVSVMRACRTRHRPPLTVRRCTPGGGGAITGGSASRQVNRRTGLFFCAPRDHNWFAFALVNSHCFSSSSPSVSVCSFCSVLLPVPIAASQRYILHRTPKIISRINQWPTIVSPNGDMTRTTTRRFSGTALP